MTQQVTMHLKSLGLSVENIVETHLARSVISQRVWESVSWSIVAVDSSSGSRGKNEEQLYEKRWVKIYCDYL
jgi:hypothetical protein